MINNIPILFAEDGFLRSADTWCNSVIDKRYTSGISFTFSNDAHYFDATRSTLMERLLNDKTLFLTKEQLNRAGKCIHYIVDNYLTKYNHQPIFTPRIGRQDRKKVLVIDQSYGDASISQGLADDNTFSEMLECAICENPDADIIIKTHPDAMAQGTSRASGYYTSIKPHDNIYTLTTPINPIALIKACDKVYVCTTQFGFEALMCGKEVHVFGMPFYAGWGLTIDAKKCERRTNKRSLAEIFYIAYIIYSHYVNPETKQPCEIEEAMEYLLSLRKEYFEKYNITNTLAVEQ
jgi:capsular polysaccharide export protein